MLETVFGRALLAVMSLAIGAVLFRGQVADALIVRGDDMLIQNAYDGAAQHYERALWLDPGSAAAVDRLSFVALQLRTATALRTGAAIASGYLKMHPFQPSILSDRALCYLKLRNYDSAYADFLRAANLSGDPQQYTFAGWAARRAGNVRKALAAWKRALSVQHNYKPAAQALSELQK